MIDGKFRDSASEANVFASETNEQSVPEVRSAFCGLSQAVGVGRGRAHKCGSMSQGTAVEGGRKWAGETSSFCSKEDISLLKDALGNLGVIP